jgi:hypothetical protein
MRLSDTITKCPGCVRAERHAIAEETRFYSDLEPVTDAKDRLVMKRQQLIAKLYRQYCTSNCACVDMISIAEPARQAENISIV